MIGKELALKASGWRRCLYSTVGTLDIDEWINYWHYRKFFFPIFSGSQPFRILDAGCNYGLWSFYLARKYPEVEVVGIDIREEAIAFCEKVRRTFDIKNTQFTKISFSAIPYTNEFDVILSFYSLHYSYRDDVEILKRFAKTLKNKGILMLSVPVARSLKKYEIYEDFPVDKQADKYGINVNLNDFSDHYLPEDLTSKLNKTGFEVIKTRRVVGECGFHSKRIYGNVNHVIQKSIIWPFAFILGWVDSINPTEDGSFLLVMARKSDE